MKTGHLVTLAVFSSLCFPTTAGAQTELLPADDSTPAESEIADCPLAPNPENLFPSNCFEPIDDVEPIPAPRPK